MNGNLTSPAARAFEKLADDLMAALPTPKAANLQINLPSKLGAFAAQLDNEFMRLDREIQALKAQLGP